MKAYVKPELFYESFELSQHIAVCFWDSNNTFNDPKTNCVFTASGESGHPVGTKAFIQQGSCGPDALEEVYCYTNADSGLGLFNS